MNGRHVGLIASYSARNSVRGGIGLVFLLLSLTLGLLVAHILMQLVDVAAQEYAKHTRTTDREAALHAVSEQAQPIVAWMLEDGSDRAEVVAGADADTWAEYLMAERPALLSAIFLVLLFGWPFVLVFGAFDLFSGDIGSRQLRYQLLRVDRGSIYFGRLLGILVIFVLVLLLLGTTVTGYMGMKLSLYSWPSLLFWATYGTVALVVASAPYVALCAWISASFGSSFASLAIASVVIGGVPLLAMYGRQAHEAASFVNYVLPWGFQIRLFHHEPSQVALAVGGCALQTALYTWLGYRKFTRRDL